MKFKLRTVSWHVASEDVPKYVAYGFTYRERANVDICINTNIFSEPSDVTVDVNSLEELMAIQTHFGYPLIVDEDTITVYDDDL